MSEKRKIDDKDLEEIAGAGEMVAGEDPNPLPPIPPSPGGGAAPPDTDDQGSDDQDLGQ